MVFKFNGVKTLFYGIGGLFTISDRVYSVFLLSPLIPVNNALFDRKNDDIGPKSGPIFQFNITILMT